MRIVLVAPLDSPRRGEVEALGGSVQWIEGPVDAEAQSLVWLSLMRGSPDLIWIVWETLVPADLELIHQFRVVRSTVRIVVELPRSLQPPDAQIATLVSVGIYDLVGAEDALADVVSRTAHYGDVARWHTPGIASGGTGRAVGTLDPEVAAAQTFTVISGKGGVGKTSFVANCLVAASAWGAIGIDADYVKPTLSLAFYAADDPDQGDLGQLLAALEASDAPRPTGSWSPRDQQTIRDWVHQSDLVAQGARLVSGPRRVSAVTPAVPPGLVTALAEAAQKMARITLIDTPGSTLEYSWLEAVQAADWLVLVTTPDAPAVLEARDVLRKLDHLQIPRNRVWLVISQRGKSGYSTAEIVQTQLPLPLLAVIPEQRSLWHHAWRLHHPPALKDRVTWTQIVEKMTGMAPDRARKKHPFRLRRAKGG